MSYQKYKSIFVSMCLKSIEIVTEKDMFLHHSRDKLFIQFDNNVIHVFIFFFFGRGEFKKKRFLKFQSFIGSFKNIPTF